MNAVEEEENDQYVYASGRNSDMDDGQLVTLTLETGHSIRFQPDTGAQCNVLPVET